MKRKKREQVSKTKGDTPCKPPCKPIVVNRHFTLDYYPDYLDPTRFVNVFRDVWNKLPLAARRAIAAYRRKEGGCFRIVEDVNGRRPCVTAYVDHFRHLCFLDACLLLSDEALRYTIAHELAHVYMFATDNNPFTRTDEGETDLIAGEWFGFEDDSDWSRAEGNVWLRYVLRMFDGTKVNDLAELRHALAQYEE